MYNLLHLIRYVLFIFAFHECSFELIPISPRRVLRTSVFMEGLLFYIKLPFSLVAEF